MRRFCPQIPVVTLLLALAVGLGSGAQPSGPRTLTVVIENMKFSPALLRVQPGDSVEFKNADLVPHNVTERRDRLFDSGMINPNATWKFNPKQKGTFNFQCIYHPDMTGSIVVGEATELIVQTAPADVELCGDL